uniref:hypothetical protein n=1 Tax=Pseudonocardia sp. CA-138482 TaxID=3240023 RepID=UPI003F499B6C
MHRLIAALGAVAVAGGVAFGLAPAAYAATPQDCANAQASTMTAQANYGNAIAVAVARAKVLGFTPDQISQAQNLLAQGLTDNTKNQLMMLYSEHANMLDLANDLPKIKAVVDTRLALDAAQAAQNNACFGMNPLPAPATTTPAPAATPAMPAPALTPAMPAPMVMPKGAPSTGDGSTVNPGHHF